MKIQFFTIYLLLLLLPFRFTAQSQKINISGFVRDYSSGEILIGTNILLYRDSLNSSQTPLKGTSTNRFGFYVISDILPGQYFILVSNIGFKTHVDSINIKEFSGNLIYNFELFPAEFELSQIIVEGKSEKETAYSKLDLSSEILNKLPSLSGTGNFYKSLEYIPGIKSGSDISRGLYIRGGSPDQNLTLVDGVILYNPAHLGNFTSTFNSEAVRDIRLIKGAFPAEYGGRLSSVLDLHLRTGTRESNKVSLGLGLVNSSLLLEGPLNKNGTYLLSGRVMYYDLLQDYFEQNLTIPRYNFQDLNAKLNYTLSKSDILSVSGMLTRDRIYNSDKSRDLLYEIGWRNGSIGLNWLHIDNESLFSNTSLSYINYHFLSHLSNATSSDSDGIYYSNSELQDFLLKREVELKINDNHLLKGGIELNLHLYRLLYSNYYEYQIEYDERTVNKNLALETSLYLQDDWKLSQNFSTNIGGRFYYFKESKYFRFEPRLSASLKIGNDYNLKGAFAVANQFLHFINRNNVPLPTDIWYPSSSNIKPAQSTQYVLGLEYNPDPEIYFVSLEGYYKKMSNLQEFKLNADLNFENNIESLFTQGQGESYGLELFVNKQAGDLKGWIGYSLAWSKRKFPELNGGNTYYPKYDRRHDLSIVLMYEISGDLLLSATWSYASGQGYTVPKSQYIFERIGPVNQKSLQLYYPALNNARLPDYHRLDISFTYDFMWGDIAMKLYLNLYNIYNRINPFSRYISYDFIADPYGQDNNNDKIPKLQELSLFPFIPMFGINISY